MRPDPRKYLWEALQAAELLAEFSRGKSFDEYQADATVDDAMVWQVITEKLPQLDQVLRGLLAS